MKNLKTFTSSVIGFILAVMFHNCAPMAESGSFQNPSINISNSETPKASTNGDGSTTSNGGGDGDGGSDGDGDGGNDDDGGSDGDGGDDDDGDDNKKPKGPEFTGTESEETGKTPITRGLY